MSGEVEKGDITTRIAAAPAATGSTSGGEHVLSGCWADRYSPAYLTYAACGLTPVVEVGLCAEHLFHFRGISHGTSQGGEVDTRGDIPGGIVDITPGRVGDMRPHPGGTPGGYPGGTAA